MKNGVKTFVSWAVGAGMGSLATVLVLRGPGSGGEPAATVATAEADRVAELRARSIMAEHVLGMMEGIGMPAKRDLVPDQYWSMDMSDLVQRDLCISFWYLQMKHVVEGLEARTGHTFEKKLGKLHAWPVEILEEQLAFMKAYEAESQRLSALEERDMVRPEAGE